MRVDEGLLHHIVELGLVSEKAEGDPGHVARMPPIEHPERALIARGGADHEGRVIIGDGGQARGSAHGPSVPRTGSDRLRILCAPREIVEFIGESLSRPGLDRSGFACVTPPVLRFLLVVFVLGWAVLGWAPVASAQVSIAAPSCEDLDLGALGQALDLEIAEVAVSFREVASPVVLLGCAPDSVRIEITDPVTDKSVARTVPRPAVDAERVLALAIAQLFLTSWLELLLEEEVPDAPGAEAAEARAREAVAAALNLSDPPVSDAPPSESIENEDAAEAPIDPIDPSPATPIDPPASIDPSVSFELSLEGGARWRSEGEQLGTAAGALRGQLVVDDLVLVGLRAGVEWGRAFRTRGSVDVFLTHLGLVVGLRTPALGPFVLDASLGVGAAVVVLEGRPNRTDVEGGSTQAVAAEGLFELAPTLRAGPIAVSLPLVLSGVAFAPQGVVTDEAPVRVDGLALSAMLRIALVPDRF